MQSNFRNAIYFFCTLPPPPPPSSPKSKKKEKKILAIGEVATMGVLSSFCFFCFSQAVRTRDLGEDGAQYFAVNVGQAKLPPLIFVGQPLVIDAEQMQ